MKFKPRIKPQRHIQPIHFHRHMPFDDRTKEFYLKMHNAQIYISNLIVSYNSNSKHYVLLPCQKCERKRRGAAAATVHMCGNQLCPYYYGFVEKIISFPTFVYTYSSKSNSNAHQHTNPLSSGVLCALKCMIIRRVYIRLLCISCTIQEFPENSSKNLASLNQMHQEHSMLNPFSFTLFLPLSLSPVYIFHSCARVLFVIIIKNRLALTRNRNGMKT